MSDKMFSYEDMLLEAVNNEWEIISIEQYQKLTAFTQKLLCSKNPMVKPFHIRKDFICFYIKYLALYFYCLCYLFFNKTIIKITDFFFRAIGLMSRVFANGPGDRGSIPGRVIAKIKKIILDASSLLSIIR